jgi:8-oxo-dGTP diphosphatase
VKELSLQMRDYEQRMSQSKMREIASAVLVDTNGRLLLQLRDDIPSIIFPGKVGLFGGHREEDETFLERVVRRFTRN